MQNCLGLYVDKNLIKYAKVSKDSNSLKVEAHGIKFYEDLEKTVKQIIEETHSYDFVSINLANENYTYSNLFNLLKPKDLERAIETEFEYFCSNNGKNKNTLEFRTIKSQNVLNAEERDKLQIIYAYTDKINVVEKIQLLDSYKIGTISPVALTIPNINKFANGENCVIVNIEDKTEITTLAQGKIQRVDKIDKGMEEIITSIAERENSISKAYEICKNTTVYTRAGENLKLEGNEYLDEIVTELFDILQEVKKVIEKNEIPIDSIYITGIGLVINNIDLFFQENFMDKKCELLIPYFIQKTNVKINVKDYAEVNSAISLAMQALDTKNNKINFSNKNNAMSTLKDILSVDITGKDKENAINWKTRIDLKGNLTSKLDGVEKGLIRFAYSIVFIIVIYLIGIQWLTNNINTKISETEEVISDTDVKIAEVNRYKSLVDARNSEYQNLIDQINKSNEELSEAYSSKNAIPNLLNKLMYVIPKGVQLLSIENTAGKSIVINAQAEKYDQLGYFKTVLAEEGILNNVTTNTGENKNGIISITIQGDLPY